MLELISFDICSWCWELINYKSFMIIFKWFSGISTRLSAQSICSFSWKWRSCVFCHLEQHLGRRVPSQSVQLADCCHCHDEQLVHRHGPFVGDHARHQGKYAAQVRSRFCTTSFTGHLIMYTFLHSLSTLWHDNIGIPNEVSSGHTISMFDWPSLREERVTSAVVVAFVSRGYLSVQTSAVLSALVFASALWLFLIYLLRYTLKALLTYHGWIFESYGKMSTSTKVWLVCTNPIPKKSRRCVKHVFYLFSTTYQLCWSWICTIYLNVLTFKMLVIWFANAVFFSAPRAWWRCFQDADHFFTASRRPYHGYLCQGWKTPFAGWVVTRKIGKLIMNFARIKVDYFEADSLNLLQLYPFNITILLRKENT